MKWVTCSKDVNLTTSLYRHLLPEGGITTLCGSTGLGGRVWKGNTSKTICEKCEGVRSRAEALGGTE